MFLVSSFSKHIFHFHSSLVFFKHFFVNFLFVLFLFEDLSKKRRREELFHPQVQGSMLDVFYQERMGLTGQPKTLNMGSKIKQMALPVPINRPLPNKKAKEPRKKEKERVLQMINNNYPQISSDLVSAIQKGLQNIGIPNAAALSALQVLNNPTPSFRNMNAEHDRVTQSKENFLEHLYLTNRGALSENDANSSISGSFVSEEGQSLDSNDVKGLNRSNSNGYMSDESQKHFSANILGLSLDVEEDVKPKSRKSKHKGESNETYNCRTCNKIYRWKSTLRRHENFECGGKNPTHECPYCAYRSKQRGNLGVHVRKHHPDKPSLVSKRRSKYNPKPEDVEKQDVDSVPSFNGTI